MIREEFPDEKCRSCPECVLRVKDGTATCKKEKRCKLLRRKDNEGKARVADDGVGASARRDRPYCVDYLDFYMKGLGL